MRRSRPVARAASLPVTLVFAAAIAGCVGATSPAPAGSSAPTGSLVANPSPTVVSTAPAAHPSAPATPTTTATSWGRIWDAVPPSFPLPAGAEPTQLTGGSTSGTFSVPAARDAAVDAEVAALRGAGYTVIGVNGPLEDGSRVIDATGAGGCRTRITVRTMGTLTVVEILVASACPFS